jgi:hypothetical protein
MSLAESLVDLREIHSVPRLVLEQLIAAGKRMASWRRLSANISLSISP